MSSRILIFRRRKSSLVGSHLIIPAFGLKMTFIVLDFFLLLSRKTKQLLRSFSVFFFFFFAISFHLFADTAVFIIYSRLVFMFLYHLFSSYRTW